MDDPEPERIRPGELASAKRRTRKPVAITAMVDAHERDLIDSAAQTAGMSRAAWSREVLLAAAARTPGDNVEASRQNVDAGLPNPRKRSR